MTEKDARIGAMYLGGIVVLRQLDNPERLVLAAHAMRELMEKLPDYLDLPVEARSVSMKEKVRELAELWQAGASDYESEGAITAALRKFLLKAVEFFAWFEEQHPKRRDRAARVIRSLDPLSGALPQPIERLRVGEWEECNGFFQGVSHHTRPTNDGEFGSWLDTFERFLLDRLRPRTFNDHAELDRLIQEGEADA